MTQPAAGRISAYTTEISAPPGTEVGLKVSTRAGGYRVSAFRIGAYRGGSGTLVWRSRFLAGERQADPVLDPVETRTVVAPWHRSLTIDTDGWQPGYYVLKLRHRLRLADGRAVRRVLAVGARHRGPGRSRHDVAGVQRVGRLQPVLRPRGRPTQLGRQLRPAVQPGDRRERLPHRGPPGGAAGRAARDPAELLRQRRPRPGPERPRRCSRRTSRWVTTSTGRRPCARPSSAARDAGTNLAFLGANTMYWRIRLDGRLQTGYRSDAALDPLRATRPAEATSQFRDVPAPEPEQTVTGMMYECYPVDAAFVVESPTWWGFDGTGARRGDRFEGLVGPEADRVYLNRSTPRPMEVLSHSPYSCRGVHDQRAGRLLHDGLRLRRLQRRHAAVGLCAGRPVRAPPRRPHPRVRGNGDRQPPAAVRRRAGRPVAPGPRHRGPLPAARRELGRRELSADVGRSAIMGRMARRVLAGALVTVLLVGFAACSGDESSPPGPDRAAADVALQVVSVKARGIDEETRTRLESEVRDVLASYVVEGVPRRPPARRLRAGAVRLLQRPGRRRRPATSTRSPSPGLSDVTAVRATRSEGQPGVLQPGRRRRRRIGVRRPRLRRHVRGRHHSPGDPHRPLHPRAARRRLAGGRLPHVLRRRQRRLQAEATS